MTGHADTDLTAPLAEALHASIQEASWATGVAMLDSDVAAFRDRTAAALLPVVREYGDRRAAEALEAAAEGWWKPGRPHRPVRDWLRARAAAMRGEAGR